MHALLGPPSPKVASLARAIVKTGGTVPKRVRGRRVDDVLRVAARETLDGLDAFERDVLDSAPKLTTDDTARVALEGAIALRISEAEQRLRASG